MCEKLRRERDRAVSELNEAIRESDEGCRLKNEIIKENRQLRLVASIFCFNLQILKT
jgi:hypothetical protein